MTHDERNAEAIGFDPAGTHVELRNIQVLSEQVLPRFFKTGNVTSFIRQLHNYGFRTKPLRSHPSVSHCFAHPDFIFGREDLCLRITKRKPRGTVSPAAAAAAAESSPPLMSQKQDEVCDGSSSETSSEDGTASRHHHHHPYSYQELVESNAELLRKNIELMSRTEQLETYLRSTAPMPLPSPPPLQQTEAKRLRTTPPPPPTPSIHEDMSWLGEMDDSDWLANVKALHPRQQDVGRREGEGNAQ